MRVIPKEVGQHKMRVANVEQNLSKKEKIHFPELYGKRDAGRMINLLHKDLVRHYC